MIGRNRYVVGGIRAALLSVPLALGIGFAAVAGATGPVQPGVTTPDAPAQSDQPAELRSAAPQSAPAPRSAPRTAPKPSKPETPAPPAPREVRIGEFRTPVPDIVPDAVVDGVNHATDGIQGAINPGSQGK